MAIKTGTAASEVLNSTAVADRLLGLGGADTLNGAGGNDTLEGGAGNDRLVGGTGNDVYVFAAGGGTDTIVEVGPGGGTDTLRSAVTVSTLANHVENLVLTGGGAINGTGNTLHNKITGNTGANKLSGGGGNDTLTGGGGADTTTGGAGNDVHIVAQAGDKVVDSAGVDTVRSSVTFTLGGGVEHLTLTGAGNINGTGNSAANILTGNTKNNTLSGAGGADQLSGGAGNDILVWDAADTVRDGGAGTDTLRVTAGTANLASEPIANMEIVDLAGNNTLNLTAAIIVAGNAFTSDTLTVNGGAGDAVNAGPGWTQLGNEGNYAVYEKDGATLKVDLDIDRSGIAVAELHLSALDGTNGFRLNGIEHDDFPTKAGGSVASAGDINGDGFEDFIVGAMFDNYGVGAAYVVFGDEGGFAPTLEASALDGTNGFVMGVSGPPMFPVGFGYSVASAGDINGDGLADLVVGAPAGLAVVVLGATSFASFLDLNGPSDAHFSISDGFPYGTSGFGVSVSSAGDLNGDGYDDIVVGAPNSYTGDAYVIYGASSFASLLDASALDGTNGFVLEGLNGYDGTGASVSAAGDVNGDGIGDLIIGADQCGCGPGDAGTGVVYVVFGGQGVESVDLGALDGVNGFVMAGISVGDQTGTSVSSAGDVNGDGISDLIVGAPQFNSEAGAAYVVFGGQDFGAVLELSALDGTTGFRISGATNEYAGMSVASAGDVNGDGYDDLIIGAPAEYDPYGDAPGHAYVVFGAAGGFASSIGLSSLDGQNGFRLRGVENGDYAGVSVASAGDVDGDGFADLIIGANYAFAGDSDFPVGEAFVVFGRDFNNVVDFLGGAGNDSFTGGAGADVFVGGRGDDLLVGGGGGDAFHAGAGNDRIVLGAGDPLRVDGGTGDDTLALGGGLALDLGQVANARITGIEGIDLVAGAGANELTLTAREILALSGTSNTLVVNGDGNDTVHAGNGWRLTDASGGYEEYTKGGATLRIDEDVNVDIGLIVSSLALSTLNGANGFRLDGVGSGDRSGQSVASAGDVDGDGFDDVIIGAYTADPDLVLGAGASYVVFGKEGGFGSAMALSSLDGTSGFRIDGAGTNHFSGGSAASAGDVDGDGLDDMIVGAFGAASYAGVSHVVFGNSAFTASVDLSALNGTNGFRLDGIDAGDRSGGAVSSAGDVNGDGIADLVVGAYFANGQAGETYVVFGTDGGFSSAIGLGTLDGTNGFRLDGIGRSGASVASAGDVNGDGIADLVIGAYFADTITGKTYVVFGQASGFGSALSLTALDGSTGFRLDGGGSGEFSGYSVASAGDVNGDGIADLIIGATRASPNGADSGESYVVFGREDGFESALSLAALDGTSGFKLGGPGAGAYSGNSVASAGDVNGDGYDDLIIGAFVAGEAYVVFGHAGGYAPELNLSTLDGLSGFRLDGVSSTGFSVSSAGDVNGDGYADVIVGAREANGTGASYVVFGRDFRGDTDLEGGDGNDLLTGGRHAEVFIGGRGDDTMIGGGGDDAFHGGEGGDRIVLGSGDPLRVDGGSGDDAVSVDAFGASIVLDGTDASVQGIEKVDLEGTHANTLVLTRGGVLAASDTSNILKVIGDEDGDAVTLLGDWQLGPLVGEVYDYWYSGNAQVWIEQGLTVNTGPMGLGALDGLNGFRIDGTGANSQAGQAVAAAGDFNHDGYDDVIMGSRSLEDSFVVFGGQSPGSALALSSLDGANGLQIEGVGGRSVSRAGDVNGDGIADVIIGNNADGVGQSYVVFGSSSPFGPVLHVSSLDGSAGFRLDGIESGDHAGLSIAGAGDVNGDGYADLFVGAPELGGAGEGEAYVVFGHGGTFASSYSLSGLNGLDGFRLDGIELSDESGWFVNAAGDLNGDGFGDIAIGGWMANGTAGETAVVFGSATSPGSAFSLSDLNGTNGFLFAGADPGDYNGYAVDSAGDINGDGITDLIIGSYGANGDAGASYVIFGSTSGFASAMTPSDLDGDNGFRVDGIAAGDYSAESVAGVGDFNGDGYDDIVIGADRASGAAGETYVVFGGGSYGSVFSLSSLDGLNGFRLDGFDPNDHSGFRVDSAGDVNGDGYADLIIGATNSDLGESYVIYGANRTGAVSFAGGDGNDVLTGSSDDEAFVGGRGNDTMTGGGGADAFSGGAGDDVISVGDAGFLRVDGGAGEDTLTVAGELDLAGVSNTRLTGIERIDLVAGGGANQVTLTLSDLLALSDTSNILTVDGDAQDTLVLDGAWALQTTAAGYETWTLGAATLVVDVDVIFIE